MHKSISSRLFRRRYASSFALRALGNPYQTPRFAPRLARVLKQFLLDEKIKIIWCAAQPHPEWQQVR